MKLFYKIMLLLYCFSLPISVTSQNLMGSISISLPAKPSANTADWATAMPPVMLIAQAKLENGKLPPMVEQSRILVGIKSGGTVVCASYTQQTAPASNFTNATKTWTGAAFTDLLGKDCILKPGTYELCVKFISSNMASANIVIGEACKSFTIEDKQQQQYSPPQNMLPADNKKFSEQEMKAPITFKWTPVVPKPRDPVIYRLKVWHIEEGQTGEQAMRTNQPIVTKDIENKTQSVERITWPCNMTAGPRCPAIWVVEAFSNDGAQGKEKSLGTSEPFTFNLKTSVVCLCQPWPATIPYSLATVCGGASTISGSIANYGTITTNDCISFPGLVAPCNTTPCTGIVKYWLYKPNGTEIFGNQTFFNSGTLWEKPCNDTGTYKIVIRAKCDADICSDLVIFVKKPCPPQQGSTNCCLNSSWGEKSIINSSGVKKPLPPCGNNFGLQQCNSIKTFKVCYNCNQNCQGATAQIKYEIFNGTSLISSTTAASCNIVNITTPAVSGSYSLVISAMCGDSVCNTCTYYFQTQCVPNCDCGQWGSIVVNNNQYKCGDLIKWNCKVPFNFSSLYQCNPNDSICKAATTWEVKKGSIVVASGTGASSIIGSFTPTTNGIYNITLNATCNGKICPPCIFTVVVEDCNVNQNCCEGSYWKEQPKMYNAAGVVVETLQCPQTTFSFLINNGRNNCNETYTIKNAVYACATQNCPSKVIYTLTNTSTGAVLTGINSITITPALPNGNYVMSIVAICGTDTCSKCSFQIRKDCSPQQIDCCKGGKWLNKYYSVSTPLIHALPVKIECDSIYTIDYIPNGSITFNADYLCNPLLGNCNKQVLVSVKKPGTSFSILQPVSYSLPLSEPGTYKICYIAVCGKDTCDKCCFTVVIKEKKDCCKGAYWINKSIDWGNIIDKSGSEKTMKSASGPIVTLPTTAINITSCNVSYKLSLGIAYTFNADYNCPKGCAKNVKVKIEGLTNSSLDGIYNAPITKTITIDGTYKITYLAYCGDEICDSCVFYVGADKNCCLNSKWISADYQIVNKKADGSWDWVPGINPIGNSIPTLKADLGIDISNLNYQCAKGCSAGYIVRKINQSTGTLAEPDETLSPGQTTTSIYSKPYPQLIVITPTCDGQRCTPLIFRVECLNKNCVLPPCTGNKSLKINTGIDNSGMLLPERTADPFWGTGYTIPTTSIPSTTGWVAVIGAGILVPSITSTITAPGDFTFTRSFYICKNASYTLSGILRCDNQLRSLVIKNSSGGTVWTLSGIPTIGDNVYSNVIFNTTNTLTTGQYSVEATYRNRNSSMGTATIGGLALSGTITTTSGDVVNFKEDCCTTSTGLPGSSATAGQLGHIDGLNITESTSCTLTIGQNYQGGKIAYILKPTDVGYDPNVCHGLIVTVSDGPLYLCWGCTGTTIGTSSAYGSGMANTLAVVAACPSSSMANYCNNLVEGGYSDWHLPSKDELAKVFLAKNLIGGFTHYYFATSTEYSGVHFFVGGYFNDASTTYLQGTTTKNCYDNFRAVRYF